MALVRCNKAPFKIVVSYPRYMIIFTILKNHYHYTITTVLLESIRRRERQRNIVAKFYFKYIRTINIKNKKIKKKRNETNTILHGLHFSTIQHQYEFYERRTEKPAPCGLLVFCWPLQFIQHLSNTACVLSTSASPSSCRLLHRLYLMRLNFEWGCQTDAADSNGGRTNILYILVTLYVSLMYILLKDK